MTEFGEEIFWYRIRGLPWGLKKIRDPLQYFLIPWTKIRGLQKLKNQDTSGDRRGTPTSPQRPFLGPPKNV